MPIAALHHDARGQAASVDLSSGSARIVLDIFAEDASVALTLSASATFSHDNVSVSLPLFDGATLTTRDGDSLTVDLALRSPGLLESDVAKATRREVVITLCPSGGDGGACGDSRIPISALPPTVADAGAEDAGIADAPPPGPG